jgi:hypothetical protein
MSRADELRKQILGLVSEYLHEAFPDINMDEVGCVLTDKPQLDRLVRSFCDWAAIAVAVQARTTLAEGCSVGNSGLCHLLMTTSTPVLVSSLGNQLTRLRSTESWAT